LIGFDFTSPYGRLEGGMVAFCLSRVRQGKSAHRLVELVTRRAEIALIVEDSSLTFACARASTHPQIMP